MPTPTNIKFFKTQDELRKWFEKNHSTLQEQWIGFYKKNSNRQSINWQESVDIALCFGWIDGIRKSIDEISYTNRFTPRKPKSNWSAINIARVKELKKLGLMTQAGLKLFEQRDIKKTNQYSSEQRKNLELPKNFLRQFKTNKKAWKYFSEKSPSYQRTSIWWVISAKQLATQNNRLSELIHCCENETTIPLLTRKK